MMSRVAHRSWHVLPLRVGHLRIGCIRRLDSTPPPYRLGWAPNYVFDQPAFERIVRERLSELPTVTVHRSANVQAVGQDDDGAWADVHLAGRPHAERVRSHFLIACDGGSSAVRKQLGIELEDLGFDERWLVIDALIDAATLTRLRQTQVQHYEPATVHICRGRGPPPSLGDPAHRGGLGHR
jgi:3-(3-hydroxy-phenyl)propionate hydroxylase